MTAVEIWMYGSTARGDADELSDVDLLVVADSEEETDLSVPLNDDFASISRYTWDEIAGMVGYGSLFLHHIKQEGRALVEGEPPRLRQLLDELPPYQRAGQELESFSQVVEDVREAIAGDYSPQFELAVLATAARHAAILGCYLVGDPSFGRAQPFRVLLPRLGYGTVEINNFQRLYRYRVSENRGEVVPVDTRDQVETWISRVYVLIEKVRKLAG